MYDAATSKFTLLSTCFPTHHLAFSRDHEMLFFSAGVVGPAVLGWLDVKKFEQTGDEVQSQAWTPFVLDTSGDGKRGEYVEPDKPVEPGKDKRIRSRRRFPKFMSHPCQVMAHVAAISMLTAFTG
jgi:hypothetical protein